jgi:hypothetical protein
MGGGDTRWTTVNEMVSDGGCFFGITWAEMVSASIGLA